MATFSSEYDSDTFSTGEKMQRLLSYFFFSLTTDINPASQNPLVPAQAQKGKLDSYFHEPAVRVDYFFASCCLSIPIRLQTLTILREGDQRQMWEFIRI